MLEHVVSGSRLDLPQFVPRQLPPSVLVLKQGPDYLTEGSQDNLSLLPGLRPPQVVYHFDVGIGNPSLAAVDELKIALYPVSVGLGRLVFGLQVGRYNCSR